MMFPSQCNNRGPTAYSKMTRGDFRADGAWRVAAPHNGWNLDISGTLASRKGTIMISLILLASLGGLDCHPQYHHGWYQAPHHGPVYWTYEPYPAPISAPTMVRAMPAPVMPAPMPAPAMAPPAMVPPAMGHEETLCERLGGEATIKAVVDDFVARAAADPKVNFTRQGTDREWEAPPENVIRLKARLVELISSATGGRQAYRGRSMKAVHEGMRITDREFDALADDLKATLDKFHVPAREQAELLKIIGSTRRDIVKGQ
jgi:hemoglobin